MLPVTSNRRRRIEALALSQEERLLECGQIRPGEGGYDRSDFFINDSHNGEVFQTGSLVVLIGTREICTYVGPVAGTPNLHNIRHKGNSLVKSISRESFLPVPTEPAEPPASHHQAVAK